MEQSLKNFKESFTNELLQLHWRQWTALGVSAHTLPEKHWIVDLEAIIVSTLVIGLLDKRLLSAVVEWLTQNGDWVNLSRLRRIKKIFTKSSFSDEMPLLDEGIFEKLLTYINKAESNHPSNKASTNQGMAEALLNQKYEVFFDTFEIRGVVTEPEIRQPSLLQLYLRAILGVDARVEVFIYFLHQETGNSNSIAKEIYYDQKNIYRILERWAKAGIICKTPGKKSGKYFLAQEPGWFQTFGLKEKPRYLNWVKLFMQLDSVAKVLQTSPWSDDIYLLSSLFRDLADDMRIIEKQLKLAIPQPTLHPGAQYFEPFANSIIHLFEQLRQFEAVQEIHV